VNRFHCPECANREAELERIREIFGEFFPKIPMEFEQYQPTLEPLGRVTMLRFKSPVVHMLLSPGALYCARHPEDLIKSALRRQALQFADRVVEEICRAAPPPEPLPADPKGWDVT
jgi:hypothetical protein